MEPKDMMRYLPPEIRPMYEAAPDLWMALRAAVNHQIRIGEPGLRAPWLKLALDALSKAEAK